jgi:pimeloyl-ACP methyl ester carboxylesterase
VRVVSSTTVSYTATGEDIRLAGDRWEAAPAVPHRGTALLLHGGGQTRHSWKRTAERLSADGWTTITLDTRGHGDSGWSADGDYSMDAFVGDLLGICATLPEPPVLIGASLGGLTALVAEGEHPGTARALVLVDVAPRVEDEGTSRIHDFMAGAPDGFASLDEVADAVAAYNTHRPRPKNVEGLRKNVRLREDGRWHWHWDPAFIRGGDEPRRAMDPERFAEAARLIRAPLLLIRGQLSDVVSPEGAAELLSLVPHARYVDVEATGHMVAGDDNDVFTAELTGFLDGLTG